MFFNAGSLALQSPGGMSSWQWQPTRTAHDPFPPITLETPSGIVLALPTVSETDIVVSLGRVKSRALPVVSETDSVIAFGKAKSRVLPVVTESDSAVSFGKIKTKILPIVTETDIAVAITRLGAAAVVKLRMMMGMGT